MVSMKLLIGKMLSLGFLIAFTCGARAVSFTNDVAPILVQKCLTCHGIEKNKGNYRVDTFESLMKPGTSKEIPVSPGKPGASKLSQLLVKDDEDDVMPQKNEPLEQKEIKKKKKWIMEGTLFDGPAKNVPLVSIIPPIQQPDPPAAYPSPIPITALAFSPD